MDRRHALVEELRANGCLSAGELANRLGVSRRTITRDIQRLQGDGVPIRHHAGGYAFDGPEAVKRAVDRALLGREVLLIEYVNNKGTTTSREVEPSMCLGGRGGHWYLVAWCRLRQDVRVFRLDRVKNAALTGEHYPEPGRDRLTDLTDLTEAAEG
jgi:predicted DNA-binding transcriptional regulator YafY